MGRSTLEIDKPRDELIEEQNGDDSLKSLYIYIGDGEGGDTPHYYYYMKDGVLMRRWEKTPQEAETEGSKAYEQIVVPTRYRTELLCTAHEAPMAGHLRITKMYEKLTRHFYWPGIKRDVKEFCRSCKICQQVGKPNQNIPPAPLQPIPAVEETFSRVIVDCVKPLP